MRFWKRLQLVVVPLVTRAPPGGGAARTGRGGLQANVDGDVAHDGTTDAPVVEVVREADVVDA